LRYIKDNYMNYRTKIKALIEQVSRTDWEFHQACKPQNRRIFPFYCHASLCFCKYVNNEPVVLPKIPYEDHENAYDESCYWGWVVWEELKTVKFYGCHPRNYYAKLYTYNEQVYGWPEPIVFDKKFENSLEHRAVWFTVIGNHSSNRYFLNDYKNTGISETIYSNKLKETMHGGSRWGEDRDNGWFEYSASKGLELTMSPFDKPHLKLSHARVLAIINEILYENAEHQQLSLF
jgi:hypothetical protein